MSNNNILQELYNKLQNKYLDMSFDLEDDLISCIYKNGYLICRDVSNNKANGLFVEYILAFRNNNQENEILKCLNEINSYFNIRATLNKSFISFSPIYVPLFIDNVDIGEILNIFNQLIHTVAMIEKDVYFDKIKRLIEEM